MMPMEEDEIAVRIVVSGRVQGVGYRSWALAQAWRRGVRGWVRNRCDGTVEALLIGRVAEVEALIDACRIGPRAAHVSDLARFPSADDGTSEFHEKPTV
jgi:acylphosphatase